MEHRTSYKVKYKSPTGTKTMSFDSPHPCTALEAALRFETKNRNCEPVALNGVSVRRIREQAANERRRRGIIA